MKTILLFLSFATSIIVCAQIKSGPMLGYNTMKEAAVWVQMESEGEVIFSFHPIGNENEIKTVREEAKEEDWNTVHFIAQNLEPGTEYVYSIKGEGNSKTISTGRFKTQTLWQHREDPPDFSFVTGSCAYTNQKKYDRPGEPYGRNNEIFSNIASTKADFMLWLGDNIYLREPDWSSKSGIYERYTHFKSLPELQALWSSMHHYAIWDDHDFGPNDADRSFVNKTITLQAFKDFWANHSYGTEEKPGITSHFSYNDLDFFLLDNRYYRSPNIRKSGKREILGKEQLQWLIDALVNSKATFKFVAVGGQFLNPAALYENHATFNEERLKLMDLIEKEGIKNVIFLSGDRHKTELTKKELKNGNIIYDYTCSPLTSKAYDTSDEENGLRVEGTHVSTQNYGVLALKGSYKERVLSIQTFDFKGNLLWKKEIQKQ